MTTATNFADKRLEQRLRNDTEINVRFMYVSSTIVNFTRKLRALQESHPDKGIAWAYADELTDSLTEFARKQSQGPEMKISKKQMLSWLDATVKDKLRVPYKSIEQDLGVNEAQLKHMLLDSYSQRIPEARDLKRLSK